MKKLLFSVIALILVFSLVACGTTKTSGGGDTPPIGPGDTPDTPDDPNTPDTPDNPDDPNEGEDEPEGYTYTVRFMLESLPFVPSANDPVVVRWTGINGTVGVHEAKPDENGVATVHGLDGDYRVTLVNLLSRYIYNPNSDKYIVSNINRDTYVEIYDLDHTDPSSDGKGFYAPHIIDISKTGEYRVTLYDSEPVYFQFVPVNSGSYIVESWVDVTANYINPIADIHDGSVAYKNPIPHKQNTGGAEGSFTKNFLYTMDVDSDNISATGQIVFCFGIHAEISKGDYPVTVEFQLRYVGAYDRPEIESGAMVPTELPKNWEEQTEWDQKHNSYNSSFIDIEDPGCAFVDRANMLLNSEYVKYNEADGYWHVYDAILYAANDGFGPILYAKVNAPNRIIATPDFPNGASFVDIGGFSSALILSQGTEDYNSFINRYAQYANDDGMCPVTWELYEFLVKYDKQHFIFKDGYGIAEMPDADLGRPAFNAGEGSQWLFACCYYLM